MNFYGLQTIAVAAIDFGDRLRSIDENYANLLAENIAQAGRLRQPIEVRGKGKNADTFLLIAGGHRLRAAQIMNWATIDAFVYEADDDKARMAEIDENLVRHDLNPLDRAVFMFQRKEIYERLHPEAKHGAQGGRGSKRNENDTMSFSKNTAEKCGWTERTIQRAVLIAGKLAPDVRATLPGTELAKSQSELLTLAKLGHGEQRRALELLLGDQPKAKTMAAAIKLIKGVRDSGPTGDDGFKALVAKWGRATPREREAFLQHLWDHKTDDTLREFVAGLGQEEAA